MVMTFTLCCLLLKLVSKSFGPCRDLCVVQEGVRAEREVWVIGLQLAPYNIVTPSSEHQPSKITCSHAASFVISEQDLLSSWHVCNKVHLDLSVPQAPTNGSCFPG